jgi:hypothetical protein
VRCTRCDDLAVPPVLARLKDGRLVFGWCHNCVQDAGARLSRVEPAPLHAPRAQPRLSRSVRSSGRKLRRGWIALLNLDMPRRSILTMALAFLVWGSALLALAGYRLIIVLLEGRRDLLTGALAMGAALTLAIAFGMTRVGIPPQPDRDRATRALMILITSIALALGVIAIDPRGPGRWIGLTLLLLTALGHQVQHRWIHQGRRRAHRLLTTSRPAS